MRLLERCLPGIDLLLQFSNDSINACCLDLTLALLQPRLDIDQTLIDWITVLLGCRRHLSQLVLNRREVRHEAQNWRTDGGLEVSSVFIQHANVIGRGQVNKPLVAKLTV